MTIYFVPVVAILLGATLRDEAAARRRAAAARRWCWPARTLTSRRAS